MGHKLLALFFFHLIVPKLEPCADVAFDRGFRGFDNEEGREAPVAFPSPEPWLFLAAWITAELSPMTLEPYVACGNAPCSMYFPPLVRIRLPKILLSLSILYFAFLDPGAVCVALVLVSPSDMSRPKSVPAPCRAVQTCPLHVHRFSEELHSALPPCLWQAPSEGAMGSTPMFCMVHRRWLHPLEHARSAAFLFSGLCFGIVDRLSVVMLCLCQVFRRFSQRCPPSASLASSHP